MICPRKTTRIYKNKKLSKRKTLAGRPQLAEEREVLAGPFPSKNNVTGCDSTSRQWPLQHAFAFWRME